MTEAGQAAAKQATSDQFARAASAARQHASAVEQHLAQVAAMLREASQRQGRAVGTDVELSTALAELSGLLLSEAKVDTLLKRVSELAIRSVAGCDAVTVFLLRDNRVELAGWTDDAVARLDRRQSQAAEGPGVDAVRGRRRLLVDSTTIERWPRYAASWAEHGMQAALSVPMLAGGEALGALNLYARTPFAFGALAGEIAQALADQAAVALTNTRLYTEQRSLATTLQQRLLPAHLPEVAGARLTARYHPGTEGINVGGDWYDALVLPGGRVGLVIGDVAGHGIQAATVMGQLRTAVRAYVLDGYGPAAVTRRLDRFIDDLDSECYATCCYLVCDPADGTVRWCNAGHPQPAARAPDGTAWFLDGGVAPPLGVIGSSPLSERRERLQPGSTLLLYTDGLVERREEPIDVGMWRLADALTDAPDDLGACCDHLLTKLLTDGRSADDVALIALRLAGRP